MNTKAIHLILCSAFFSPLVSSFASAAGLSVPELIEETSFMNSDELCQAYNSPLDAQERPQGPFRRSRSIEDKRREAAPSYLQHFTPYLVTLPKAIEDALNSLGARVLSQRPAARETQTPRLHMIDHRALCEADSKEKAKAMAPNAEGELLKKMVENLVNDCLQESYGRANPFKNEVIFGNRVIGFKNRLSVQFAYLHELCHVQYPGIESSTMEEIFCDAVALKWGREQSLGKPGELETAALEILDPPNPYKDFLALRARLPQHCRQK